MFPTKVIPRHNACLRLSEYLIYLLDWKRSPAIQRELEAIWRPYLPDRRLLPTPTGRHALWLFLEAARLEPGDEVLVAAYNFYPLLHLLQQKRLVPLFVDIEPDTLCLDADELERRISPRSKLVITTHMFGNPARMDRIAAICRERGLLLFEDCAHAVGSLCSGRQVGSFGDGALFSFGIYKIINAFGGGMLAVRPDFCERVAKRAAGRPGPPAWASFCDNFFRFCVTVLLNPSLYTLLAHPVLRRSRKLAAAIYPSGNDPGYVFDWSERPPFKPYMLRMIRAQLARLDGQIARRTRNARQIQRAVEELPGVTCFDEAKHGRPNFGYFAIGVPDAAGAARKLARQRILTGAPEYYDCSRLPQFAPFFFDCPSSRRAEQRVLRLPNYPTLSDRDLRRIIAALRRAAADSATR